MAIFTAAMSFLSAPVVLVLLISHAGRQHEQPKLLELYPAIGDPFLCHLQGRERTIPGRPETARSHIMSNAALPARSCA